jgi:hypothetical protein
VKQRLTRVEQQTLRSKERRRATTGWVHERTSNNLRPLLFLPKSSYVQAIQQLYPAVEGSNIVSDNYRHCFRAFRGSSSQDSGGDNCQLAKTEDEPSRSMRRSFQGVSRLRRHKQNTMWSA